MFTLLYEQVMFTSHVLLHKLIKDQMMRSWVRKHFDVAKCSCTRRAVHYDGKTHTRRHTQTKKLLMWTAVMGNVAFPRIARFKSIYCLIKCSRLPLSMAQPSLLHRLLLLWLVLSSCLPLFNIDTSTVCGHLSVLGTKQIISDVIAIQVGFVYSNCPTAARLRSVSGRLTLFGPRDLSCVSDALPPPSRKEREVGFSGWSSSAFWGLHAFFSSLLCLPKP